VPFHREEFTGKISAFFNLDVSQILGYGLGEDAENLLLALALYKIRALLDKPFRPRTACDLEVQSIEVKRPDGYVLPTLNELESVLPKLIKTASKSFASPPTTTVTFE
jgi:CRISPR-associated protein Csb1